VSREHRANSPGSRKEDVGPGDRTPGQAERPHRKPPKTGGPGRRSEAKTRRPHNHHLSPGTSDVRNPRGGEDALPTGAGSHRPPTRKRDLALPGRRHRSHPSPGRPADDEPSEKGLDFLAVVEADGALAIRLRPATKTEARRPRVGVGGLGSQRKQAKPDNVRILAERSILLDLHVSEQLSLRYGYMVERGRVDGTEAKTTHHPGDT